MTIKDVAAHCGVSVSTVSRVLNNHPDVREAVRAKVMKSVQELHYIPNSSARDLVKPQSDSIGVIVRGAGNLFFTSMLPSIEREIEKEGYQMILHQINAEEDELLAGAYLSRSKRLRGLLFLGGGFDYTPEQAATLEIPFVSCTYTNSFGTLDKTAFSSVSIDDQKEACKAVRYLIERGHRNIAILLDSVKDRSISELRYRGYCDALEEAGITPDPELVMETIEYDMDAAYKGMSDLLKRRPDITAVFAIADIFGIVAIKALHEAGKQIPEDCSVIAIDGIDMSVYTVPTLTTLVQPREIMGTKAVHALIRVLKGSGKNTHQYLETRLREGGTVGRAK